MTRPCLRPKRDGCRRRRFSKLSHSQGFQHQLQHYVARQGLVEEYPTRHVKRWT